MLLHTPCMPERVRTRLPGLWTDTHRVQILPVGTTGTYSIAIIKGRTAGCNVNYLGTAACGQGAGVQLQALQTGATGYQQWTFTQARLHACPSGQRLGRARRRASSWRLPQVVGSKQPQLSTGFCTQVPVACPAYVLQTLATGSYTFASTARANCETLLATAACPSAASLLVAADDGTGNTQWQARRPAAAGSTRPRQGQLAHARTRWCWPCRQLPALGACVRAARGDCVGAARRCSTSRAPWRCTTSWPPASTRPATST